VGKNVSDRFPIRYGLKQGDALSSMLFNFALEYAIRRVQVNQDGMKLNGTHILNNRHEYGTMNNLMTLLKPIHTQHLLTTYEQFYIHSFHKHGSLISEQIKILLQKKLRAD